MLHASMPRRPPTVARLLASGALALFAAAAQAQDLPQRLPPDGEPRRIARVAEIPPPLREALRQADCRQDDAVLLAFPIELFRPAASARPMAIAPCIGLVLHGRAFVFERDAGEPRPLAFPVMAFPGRVSASETPGVLAWNPDTKTLVALQGNDVCEGVVARHTYRHDQRRGGDDLNGFALVKVERGKLGCYGASENWQVIWEN